MSAKLSATSREPEEYAAATAGARLTREQVADQVRELIVEGDRMGGRSEVALRIRRVAEAEQRIEQAQGRQQQAREEGLPVQTHREAEKEGRLALRAAAMSLGVAAASWAAALDHAQAQSVG